MGIESIGGINKKDPIPPHGFFKERFEVERELYYFWNQLYHRANDWKCANTENLVHLWFSHENLAMGC